ncbi:CRISPR-associated endonuclease/helicase Cas3 [Sinosporangium album]|uniref:CRISPR-associated endonuclease/helicase Cas3 n=1 Tax=Sinosporangium album TaxID=504805 RepID=A0A1G7VRS2_9ACTN|nr:CRISPR-associated helicase/endonuclease Cas3 [Sinosporangium album]SDG62516.1 CRISPR-associated endonuclease/helicase Cas3 [Sinosporangium album]
MRLPTVLAKSRPRENLTSHLAATLAGAMDLCRRVGRIAPTESVTGDRFWPAVCLAALCHDAGKTVDGFQAMLRGRIRSWGERHEVVSLGFLPGLITDEKLLLWVAAGVATHHRSLDGDRRSLMAMYGGADETEWRQRLEPLPAEVADELSAWLSATAAQANLPIVVSPESRHDVLAEALRVFDLLIDKWEFRVERDEGLTAVLLQGAVTLSDHLSSAHGVLHMRQPLDEDFRSLLVRTFAAKGRIIRPHQDAAGAVDGHLILRAPTGSGKTEAGLLWAATQVSAVATKTGGVPRVFLTLPYLASINAMAERLGRLLGDDTLIGVAHSRAASYHLSKAICPDDDDGQAEAATKAVSRAHATRLFRETVRVGTPYQILRGVLAGPAHSSILIDSANSVFILDELHAYDPRRLGYILAAARLWERLGGRIAVLSATLPDALANLFTDTLDQPVHTVEADTTGARLRHRLGLRNRHLTDPASITEMKERLARGESVLVIANNVADAQHLFAELSPQVEHRFLLHSRFRRMDRAKIERLINDHFGVDGSRQAGLLVATQVVEVSLDVDFDCLFTSAAPLEALIQRFGRVNRIGARPAADVLVHTPRYAPRRRGGEDYADGVYPQLPVQTGASVLSRHDGEAIDEAHATAWLDEVYGTAWGLAWREDVLKHRQTFDEAFLRFAHPYAGRSDLTERFDELFDGTEAILVQDRDAYIKALDQGGDDKAAGQLLGERYLLPLPYWSTPLTTWEKRLGVRIVEADYDKTLGLGEIRGPAAHVYQAGEVL